MATSVGLMVSGILQVDLLLVPNAHDVVPQQFLLVRLFVEECARSTAPSLHLPFTVDSSTLRAASASHPPRLRETSWNLTPQIFRVHRITSALNVIRVVPDAFE